MAIIWVVEDKKDPFTLAHMLMGDFPTRIFRSKESFLKLGSLRSAEKPRAIIVALEEKSGLDLDFFLEVDRLFPDVCRVYLGGNYEKLASNHWSYAETVEDPLKFSKASSLQIDRYERKNGSEIVRGDTVLDLQRNELRFLADQSLERLTLTETRILEMLFRNVNQCISKDLLRERVWGATKISTNTLDSHLSRIRKRLEKSQSLQLNSVYGLGVVVELND